MTASSSLSRICRISSAKDRRTSGSPIAFMACLQVVVTSRAGWILEWSKGIHYNASGATGEIDPWLRYVVESDRGGGETADHDHGNHHSHDDGGDVVWHEFSTYAGTGLAARVLGRGRHHAGGRAGRRVWRRDDCRADRRSPCPGGRPGAVPTMSPAAGISFAPVHAASRPCVSMNATCRTFRASR